MNHIHQRLLPKNSFTSIIYHKLLTHYNIPLLFNHPFTSSIVIKNESKNESKYNYRIDILDTSTIFNIMLSTDFNNQKLKIYEKINFYSYKNTKRINYSCNITQNIDYQILYDKPLIYSIKCCHQTLGFDLTNHYTKDIQLIFEHFISTNSKKN